MIDAAHGPLLLAVLALTAIPAALCALAASAVGLFALIRRTVGPG